MSTDYNKIFHKVPVQIPNKSGFDMSFENLFTSKVGTLTPALCEFLLPNDTVTLGQRCQVQLPPMATDFYGRVQAKMEAFFVPCRLLYGGWQELMTHPTNGSISPASTDPVKYLPHVYIDVQNLGPGSLADYLGYKVSTYIAEGASANFRIPNILPFLAYHKVWSDWYRDSRIQQDCFNRPSSQSGLAASLLPYQTFYSSSHTQVSPLLADGKYLYNLRQRNWSKDMFTNATPLPQAGQGSNLAFSVQDGTGTFSIASLRVANSIQQWMERNNLAGYRYGDQIKARFGIYPADAVLDRSIYLGSSSFDIYNKSVYQTSPSQSQSNNPFSDVGSKYASPLGVGDGSLVDSFTASEHGYLFVMFSIVPSAYYGSGIKRHFWCSTMADFPDPLLAGVGDQEIYVRELTENPFLLEETADRVFGYTQRFSEYKFINDEVHGLLRDGESLQSFALQRSFPALTEDEIPELSSQFIEIPENFMDQVTAVTADASRYGAWVDLYFSFKKSSTLPAYSLPTLGDPKDTHTEIIDNGGKRL